MIGDGSIAPLAARRGFVAMSGIKAAKQGPPRAAKDGAPGAWHPENGAWETRSGKGEANKLHA